METVIILFQLNVTGNNFTAAENHANGEPNLHSITVNLHSIFMCNAEVYFKSHFAFTNAFHYT